MPDRLPLPATWPSANLPARVQHGWAKAPAPVEHIVAPQRWYHPFSIARRGGRMLWRLRYLIATLVIAGAVAAGAFAGWDFVTKSPYFDLTDVVYAGGSVELRRDLEDIANLDTAAGLNLLLLDANELATRLRVHPRVDILEVSKEYPNRLRVDLVERQPMALIGGTPSYRIDRAGIAIAEATPSDLTMRIDWPLLTGIDTARIVLGEKVPHPLILTALELSEQLNRRFPDVAGRVGEWHLSSPPVGLELVLTQGGLRVTLGDAPTSEQLLALRALLRQRSEELTAADRIDLRFTDQAIITPKPTPEPPKKKRR